MGSESDSLDGAFAGVGKFRWLTITQIEETWNDSGSIYTLYFTLLERFVKVWMIDGVSGTLSRPVTNPAERSRSAARSPRAAWVTGGAREHGGDRAGSERLEDGDEVWVAPRP